jgi:hypothetical protein
MDAITHTYAATYVNTYRYRYENTDSNFYGILFADLLSYTF